MMINKSFCIKAVLFDFDGTLTQPGALNFPLLKETIGCPADIPVLEFIENLPASRMREEVEAVLERFESNAAADSLPNDGAEALVPYLRSKGLHVGIISRNSLESIKQALKNFKNLDPSDFDLIISRDAPVKPKPSGDGILMAAEKLNIDVKQVLMVGDYVFDIQAGIDAGAVTMFLSNASKPVTPEVDSDYAISNLKELKDIIRRIRPLPAGKLPNELLEEFLDHFAFDDPSVLINQIGRAHV